MATTPTLLSIDRYLRTSYHPDADFVDGEIEERNLGEYDRAKLLTLFAFLFTLNEDAWAIDPVIEQRIRVSPTRVRVADVAILHANAPHEEVTATPPLLCIEILSPEDRLSRVKVRLADYLAMGVQNIWLIDPIRRSAFTFDTTGLHPADSTNLTIPNTPIHLDLTPFFAKLDQKTGATS